MNDDAELAAGRRTAEALRTLASQAGLTISELGDLVESRGRDAAIRIAVGRVEQRNRGRHLVEARRRLVGYYESTP
jgi:hypothetical protein